AAIQSQPPDGRPPVLVIAGTITDPPYAARLQSLCRELGIVDAVRFVGEVRHAELPRLYRRAEIFVQTSLAETFSHPLVEAMASGVPVIASDLGVAREVCADAVSYYPAGDSAALERRMRELMATETLRGQRIAQGRARAGLYSWAHTARRTVDLLEAA